MLNSAPYFSLWSWRLLVFSPSQCKGGEKETTAVRPADYRRWRNKACAGREAVTWSHCCAVHSSIWRRVSVSDSMLFVCLMKYFNNVLHGGNKSLLYSLTFLFGDTEKSLMQSCVCVCVCLWTNEITILFLPFQSLSTPSWCTTPTCSRCGRRLTIIQLKTQNNVSGSSFLRYLNRTSNRKKLQLVCFYFSKQGEGTFPNKYTDWITGCLPLREWSEWRRGELEVEVCAYRLKCNISRFEGGWDRKRRHQCD